MRAPWRIAHADSSSQTRFDARTSVLRILFQHGAVTSEPASFFSDSDPDSVHPEIKYKKPQCQYNLCQECGFLYLISHCNSGWLSARLMHCPARPAGLSLLRRCELGARRSLAQAGGGRVGHREL
eukprot:3463302-Rhodomonas_salina.2